MPTTIESFLYQFAVLEDIDQTQEQPHTCVETVNERGAYKHVY